MTASYNLSLLGSNYNQGGSGAVARTTASKLQESVSVKDFGAVGDGVTDDTAALNAAVAWAKANGGGDINIPKGNYYVTTRVGTDPQGTSDVCSNTRIIGQDGATITMIGSYAGTVLCLSGNNVEIRGLTITSTRTIDHHANLVTQRTPYVLGIIVGGKISTGTLSNYVSNVRVTDCQVYNMNQPITVTQASSAWVVGCIIDEFTDSGIIVQDCGTDIWIERNKITRGGDDCIFIRQYSTSPWAVAGYYCGRVKVRGNILNDTFGKNVGVGGYGDVEISGNYCGLSYAGGINLEKDSWYNTNQSCYRNYLISNNQIYLAGRNWSTTEAYSPHQTPATGANPSGIQMVYLNTSGSVNYQNVSIVGNQIVNPYYDGIALSAVGYAFINGNTCSPGSYSHGASSYNTQGYCWDVYSNVTYATFINNKTSGELGVTLAYTSSVATGSPGPTNNISFANNQDVFSTEAVTYSDGSARTGTTYSVLHYGDQGTATFSAGTTVICALTRYQPDTNYRVTLGPQANKTFWVDGKTTYQFRLNASAVSSDTVEWAITR